MYWDQKVAVMTTSALVVKIFGVRTRVIVAPNGAPIFSGVPMLRNAAQRAVGYVSVCLLRDLLNH